MPKKRSRLTERDIDMTPMIDVVFQLIIFFIVTVKLEEELFKPVDLADAKHGPAIEEEDPRTVIITVDRRGTISIGSAVMSPHQLRGILRGAISRHGYGIPVLVRGDKEALHERVRMVMDACASVGLWQIKFAAMKELAPS